MLTQRAEANGSLACTICFISNKKGLGKSSFHSLSLMQPKMAKQSNCWRRVLFAMGARFVGRFSWEYWLVSLFMCQLRVIGQCCSLKVLLAVWVANRHAEQSVAWLSRFFGFMLLWCTYWDELDLHHSAVTSDNLFRDRSGVIKHVTWLRHPIITCKHIKNSITNPNRHTITPSPGNALTIQ